MGLGIGEMGQVRLWTALHISNGNIYACRKKLAGFGLWKILRREHHWKNVVFWKYASRWAIGGISNSIHSSCNKVTLLGFGREEWPDRRLLLSFMSMVPRSCACGPLHLPQLGTATQVIRLLLAEEVGPPIGCPLSKAQCRSDIPWWARWGQGLLFRFS